MWPAICCIRRNCRSFSVSANLTTKLDDAPWKRNEKRKRNLFKEVHFDLFRRYSESNHCHCHRNMMSLRFYLDDPVDGVCCNCNWSRSHIFLFCYKLNSPNIEPYEVSLILFSIMFAFNGLTHVWGWGEADKPNIQQSHRDQRQKRE